MAGSGWSQKNNVDGSELVNALKSAVQNVEDLVWKNDELKKEIERKEKENELVQGMFEIEVLERLKLQKEFEKLEDLNSRLREERDALVKRLNEKEDDHNENIRSKICALECEKLKAKTEVDVYEKRIKELEGRLLIIKNVENDASVANSGKRKVCEENSNPNPKRREIAKSEEHVRVEKAKNASDHEGHLVKAA